MTEGYGVYHGEYHTFFEPLTVTLRITFAIGSSAPYDLPCPSLCQLLPGRLSLFNLVERDFNMRLYILLPILAVIKLCSAGWPCCLRGSEEENDDADGLNRRNDNEASGSRAHERAYSQSEEPLIPSDMHALDLANPSPQQVYKSEEIHDNILWHVLTPKANVKITHLVDDGIIFAEVEGTFKHAKITPGHRNRLLFIRSKVGGGWKISCFEKRNGRWKRIGGAELRRRSRRYSSYYDDRESGSGGWKFWKRLRNQDPA
ncbi:hypothetical protein BEWA_046930 [Theileria equi strain WA]|uniref:Signal peptide-containing protein n=1 Tax=Theileria equi strain WA TaxID=1537102 RepID=L1LAE3_THEEQ|nr:hypothetical protein BEWA_046930 [Theileria equi strain WA]EKX72229.1 hypothetical protein BEWA_046930 [Theileria equi strain WA]|eukprot:XP_004831681.1 hypothetical protein BEWA_046930 [Theileria equi strain WA]